MVEDSCEGMCIQPRWSEDIGTALAFEEKRKPERDVTPLRRVQRPERALHYSQILCRRLGITAMSAALLAGLIHPAAPVLRVFGAVSR